MMGKINFTKMVASGNDFVLMRYLSTGYNLSQLARKVCDRKFGIGADGLLILEPSKKADIRMRIFNADGSEAQMCGNGARCSALFAGKKSIVIETKAGIIESLINKYNVKIKLTKPKNLKLNIPITIDGKISYVNFINTGVPHAVIFVKNLDKLDVFKYGRKIRHHKKFSPYGTNVDFIRVLDKTSIKLRTYERGVEDETLACGTGAAASAIIAGCKFNLLDRNMLKVFTKGGELLKVYFDRTNNIFKNVWLEGKVRIAYKGVYYV